MLSLGLGLYDQNLVLLISERSLRVSRSLGIDIFHILPQSRHWESNIFRSQSFHWDSVLVLVSLMQFSSRWSLIWRQSWRRLGVVWKVSVKGQVGKGSIWIGQFWTDQIWTAQNGTGQVGKGWVGTDEVWTGQVGTDQVRTGQFGTDQVRASQPCTGQIGIGQVGTCWVNTSPFGSGHFQQVKWNWDMSS